MYIRKAEKESAVACTIRGARTKSDSGHRSRATKNVQNPTTTEYKQSSPRIKRRKKKNARAKHPKQNEWITQMWKANIAWGKGDPGIQSKRRKKSSQIH